MAKVDATNAIGLFRSPWNYSLIHDLVPDQHVK